MKHQVRDWMSKHPIKIDKYESVETAGQIMKQEGIRHLLVFDTGRLIGVLSETDLNFVDKVKARFEKNERDCQKPLKVTVGDLMGRFPITISIDGAMTDAIRIMREKSFRSLPVVETDGKICGILTETDLMRYALVMSQQNDNSIQFTDLMSGT